MTTMFYNPLARQTLSRQTLARQTVAREFAVVNSVMNKFFERPYGSNDYVHNGGSTHNKASNGNVSNDKVSNDKVQSENPVSLSARLPLDAQATEDAFVFTAYLPGVKPEAVEITFENDELTIKGEFPKRDESNGYIKSELFHGGFERKLNFNTPVNAESIEASFENGVLTLQVPKVEAAKPKKIAVMVK